MRLTHCSFITYTGPAFNISIFWPILLLDLLPLISPSCSLLWSVHINIIIPPLIILFLIYLYVNTITFWVISILRSVDINPFKFCGSIFHPAELLPWGPRLSMVTFCSFLKNPVQRRIRCNYCKTLVVWGCTAAMCKCIFQIDRLWFYFLFVWAVMHMLHIASVQCQQ